VRNQYRESPLSFLVYYFGFFQLTSTLIIEYFNLERVMVSFRSDCRPTTSSVEWRPSLFQSFSLIGSAGKQVSTITQVWSCWKIC